MKPLTSLPRRRLLLLLTPLLVIVLLVGVGVYGILTGSRGRETPAPTSAESPTQPESPQPSATRRSLQLPAIPPSENPESFARSVATAIFTWDTASGFMPLDYTAIVLAVGDPTGSEQAGLAADIATYLPTRETWIGLRQYVTTQQLEITRVYVPDSWAVALTQAQPGQLPTGTTAITVEGTRHREGTWNGEKVTSDGPVSFTIFTACPPAQDCYLLRLSQLDNPLQ